VRLSQLVCAAAVLNCNRARVSLVLTDVTVRFLKFWLPVVIWMLVIFSASTGAGRPQNTSRFLRPLLHIFKPDLTDEQFEKVHYAIRKTGHFVEYAVLGLLLWRALRTEKKFGILIPPAQFVAVLLLCAFYASTDEFHQRYVKGREPSVHDVILDSCGAACGLVVYGLATRKKKRI
jgi:VanZ family protein